MPPSRRADQSHPSQGDSVDYADGQPVIRGGPVCRYRLRPAHAAENTCRSVCGWHGTCLRQRRAFLRLTVLATRSSPAAQRRVCMRQPADLFRLDPLQPKKNSYAVKSQINGRQYYGEVAGRTLENKCLGRISTAIGMDYAFHIQRQPFAIYTKKLGVETIPFYTVAIRFIAVSGNRQVKVKSCFYAVAGLQPQEFRSTSFVSSFTKSCFFLAS